MINYIIQVLLFQALFLAVYDLFLQKETFFKWNRAYLILTPILSFIIPALKFETIQESVPEAFITQMPEVFINPQAVIEMTVESNAQIDYFELFFFVGMGLFAVLFLARLYKITKLILSNKVIKKTNYSLVVLNDQNSAFSFFKYIFINNKLKVKKELQIIQHELVHCNQLHSADLLFFELLKIVLWFNPLIYVYQKRITLLHEYISDAETVKETDKKTYFEKLLSETFNVEHISFINQFFKHSLIKKRIVMITKNKSSKVKQLRYLLIVPLLGLMLIYSSFDDFKAGEEEIIENVLSVPYENEIVEVGVNEIPTEVHYSVIDKTPVFPNCAGSEADLKKCFRISVSSFLVDNFNKELLKQEQGWDGLIASLSFFIDKNGKVNRVEASSKYEVFRAEAIRLANLLPIMKPGYHKGEKVDVHYTNIPISFKNVETQPIKIQDQEYDMAFSAVEHVPVFPGCDGTEEELRKCLVEGITRHVNRTFNADLANDLDLLPGMKRIFVMFKIDKEGKIADVTARAPHDQLVDEAARVVASLPKMKPGKNKGKTVGVKYSLPIAFKIDGEKEDGKALAQEIVKEELHKTQEVQLNDDIPFAILDNVPVFPGCEGSEEEIKNCFMEQVTMHVNRNFNADLAKTLGLRPGVKKIFSVFTIGKDGKLADLKVRGPHESLIEETKRVLNLLPQFQPGKFKGKIVNVKYSIPIAFNIDGKADSSNGRKLNKVVKNGQSSKAIALYEVVLNDKNIKYPKLKNGESFTDCLQTDYDELVKCYSEKVSSHVYHNFDKRLIKNMDKSKGNQRVFAVFEVTENGTGFMIQTRAEVPELGDELKRVLSKLPNLNIGVKYDSSKRLRYSLPIHIKVN